MRRLPRLSAANYDPRLANRARIARVCGPILDELAAEANQPRDEGQGTNLLRINCPGCGKAIWVDATVVDPGTKYKGE